MIDYLFLVDGNISLLFIIENLEIGRPKVRLYDKSIFIVLVRINHTKKEVIVSREISSL